MSTDSCRSTVTLSRVLLAVVTLGLMFLSPVLPAQDAKEEKEEGKKSKFDLHVWGKITPIRGSEFFRLKYTRREGRKLKREEVFFKLGSDVEYFQDKLMSVKQLKESETVWIFGRPEEKDAPDAFGGIGVDRQIMNTGVIATGSGLIVNREFKDRRDPARKWFDATVAKPGASIWVTFKGGEYKVIMAKSTPVFARTALDEPPKKGIKKNSYVEVLGVATEERPEVKSKKDKEKKAFVVSRVVILDRRLQKTAYPILIK